MKIEKLYEETQPYLNQLVIQGFEVVRLMGVVEDEDDFYYVFDNYKKGTCHVSILAGFIPLKGLDGYDMILRLWNLNNEVKAV